jgi:hypothetical protein
MEDLHLSVIPVPRVKIAEAGCGGMTYSERYSNNRSAGQTGRSEICQASWCAC